MSFIVDQQGPDRYALPMQEVIASNQSRDVLLGIFNGWPPEKNVSAIQDRQFGISFDRELRSPLEALLLSSLPDCSWSMNVLHLGFKNNGNDNPMVIHVLVQTPGYFDDKKGAAELVQNMEKIVRERLETPEKIFIDVCEIRSSRDSDTGVNLCTQFSGLYTSFTPRPGLSIGRKHTSSASSLAGFVKHRDEIFSLTCRHVVLPTSDSQRGPDAYKYKDGKEKLMITMPTADDHEDTKYYIKGSCHGASLDVENLQDQQAMAMDKDFTWRIEAMKMVQKLHADKLTCAEQYEIDAGYIYAAPEEWRRTDTDGGILDWALIRNEIPDPENALPALEYFPKKMEKFVNEFCHNGDLTREESENLTNKYEALRRTKILHIKHPHTFSDPHDKALYIKPASRTSDWMACRKNSIKSIIYENGRGTSHEHVFVGRGWRGVASEPGDSGCLIYDIDIIPGPGNALNTAALLPMAMIWGGHISGQIVSAFRDVTYATPIGVVLKDIESSMGWEEGSLRFC